MATPQEKLADALDALKALQDQGVLAIRSEDLSRLHRERLVEAGFLQSVMRGWYIASRQEDLPGETTAWFTSFWGFCTAYLDHRYGESWCLSPEQSLLLHTGNWTVPKQLLVRCESGNNKSRELLHGISIFDARLKMPLEKDVVVLEGVRVFCLASALINAGPHFFTASPDEACAALLMVSGDFSDLLGGLLDGGHSQVAGRLAGAFRNVGKDEFADEIMSNMKSAGYQTTEKNPLDEKSSLAFRVREVSPYTNRMKMMWEKMREPVITNFPVPPTRFPDAKKYLKQVEDIFVSDAYHSLSIEGYQVSHELIEKVRLGNWNPDQNEEDRVNKDALAAKGYRLSFQRVTQSLQPVLCHENAGEVARKDHSEWYKELFGPCAEAGMVKRSDLIGYRNARVLIRHSRHVPPNFEAVRQDLMPAFFELLKEEKNPAVRVVLGHFVFVYIHPYLDGNGRMARFVMNVMMASGGYPWLVVPVEKRRGYMTSLEAASVGQDIVPFTRFLAGLM